MTALSVLTAALLLQIHPVSKIDSIMNNGVESGVFPGGVVVVGTADSILLKRGFGYLTWTPGVQPDPDRTLYDLASLTKVVATTSSILTLVQDGLLALDTPLVRYVRDFLGEGKEAVTLRRVLEHRSGLRAFLPLNTLASDPTEARRLVVSEKLRWPVGTRVVYSDLNGMLAGWAVEGASGEPLDEVARRRVFQPLGMTETQYGVRRSAVDRAAPINLWRGHPIVGVVHDQNAERLGGVSGHAGLYSTGADVARLSQWYLRRGKTETGVALVSADLVEEFTTRGEGNRALGWEMKDTTSTDNAGELFSNAAFGHTGFTGTSVWIDPEKDVFVVLLTNRVMAPRHPRPITALKRIRGSVADAAVELRRRACRINLMVSAGNDNSGNSAVAQACR